MTAARGFARYLSGIDPATEVPPLGLMPHRQRWRQPFIYSPADIDAVMSQARCSIASPLRAATYDTLIGLLAASGLRIGEAIKLDRGDIDWAEGVLLIRESKFGKSRLVPLHDQQHAGARGLRRPARRAPAATEGAELLRLPDPQPAAATPSSRQTFRQLVDNAGVGADAPSPPRLHDLRHTFAVRTLLGWYRAGEDVQAKIPSLSTYLGHREPAPPTGTCRPRPSCSPWPPPARTPRGRRPGHDPDRADPAGLLHRPARPAAASQPAHHRGLPRHPAAAAGVRAPADRQAARRSWTGTTWTPR